MFREFGYPVAETQSLGTVRARNLWSWQYNLFLALAAASVAAAVWRWLSRRPGSLPWPDLGLLMAMAALSAAMVRNIPLFCLLLVPILSKVIAEGLARAEISKYVALAGCAIGLICAVAQYTQRSATAGIGLRPGVNGAAEFLRANSIGGPVWNDFDIGGYLIFHRFRPGSGRDAGVFVDPRPEAYPLVFFTDTYIPMLFDNTVWQRVDGEFQFNALVYSLQDGFPGIERSILARVRDPEWAPVYTDFYSLIFVRRTPEHAAVIEKHLIPREAFR